LLAMTASTCGSPPGATSTPEVREKRQRN
jgi:hypothetical protein